jgi:RNA polymerase sigma-70 factor (ECF subfamily)
MLGSLAEAEDAVQEAWLRLNRADAGPIENLGGWLTTVVARVSLDMLRSRASRREDALDARPSEAIAASEPAADPEREALLADSVGLALLVVLDRLEPAERLAFVLHDLFAVPFEEIAPIVGRTPAAARQLASRARRRVQGGSAASSADLTRRREVADAFLGALRAGDYEGLLAVLDPDVVAHFDAAAGAAGGLKEIRGAQNWARGAVAFARAARFAQTALLDGDVGLILASSGRLYRAIKFTIEDGRIVEAEIIGEPDRLRALDVATL